MKRVAFLHWVAFPDHGRAPPGRAHYGRGRSCLCPVPGHYVHKSCELAVWTLLLLGMYTCKLWTKHKNNIKRSSAGLHREPVWSKRMPDMRWHYDLLPHCLPTWTTGSSKPRNTIQAGERWSQADWAGAGQIKVISTASCKMNCNRIFSGLLVRMSHHLPLHSKMLWERFSTS